MLRDTILSSIFFIGQILISNLKTYIRILANLTFYVLKSIFSRKPIKLQIKLDLFLAFLKEFIMTSQIKSGNVPRHLEILFDKKVSLELKGHEADLRSDFPQYQINFIRAGNISTEIFRSIGIPNNRLRFVGKDIVNSIGHAAMCLSLRKKILDVDADLETKYLITAESKVNNNFLSYWYSFFPPFIFNSSVQIIIEREVWPFFEDINSVGTKGGVIPLLEAHDKYTRAWENLSRDPILKLTDEHRAFGYKFLEDRNFSKISNGRFITIHVRNSKAWVNGKLVSSSPGRNASLDTYRKTANHLMNLGYFVVLVGEPSNNSLASHPQFIDYSRSKHQIDKLNTFFLAECDFLIGTNSGPICVPPCFGKRVLMTNAPSIGRSAYFTDSLVLPKMVRSGSYVLTLDEMYKTGAFWSDSDIDFQKDGSLGWLDNSEDDILEGALEMLTRPAATISADQERLELLLRSYGSVATGTISKSFISKWHKNLTK